MTKSEFATLAMALKTYYPRENILPNDKAMELWFFQLQDIDYKVAEAGLNKWVSLNKWSPSIADIRQMASEITHSDLPDWSEGWEQVMRAIRRYGNYRYKEALDSMSPLTKKVVERLGFTELCMSENISVDRANFRMIYETLAEREKKDAQIPLILKEKIMEIQGTQQLLEGGNGIQQY